MALELVKEKWTSRINTLKIGATKEEGGTRARAVTVGGEATLPFLHFEGEIPHPPAVAMEVLDYEPKEWPEVLKEPFGNALKNPVEWARKCVDEYGTDLVCLKFAGAHPDAGNKSADECVKVVKGVLGAVGVPLIVIGCGLAEKDNEILPRLSEAAKGEDLLLGNATQDNYKTLVAACQADGHSIIAESPLDINIAKQVNVLISDSGFPLERIAVYPTTGGLGYGLDYSYSIMERARIGGLSGDRMLAQPLLCSVGPETWRAKESKAPEAEHPEWGPEAERGPLWEAITAVAFLHSGGNIMIMRHPRAVASVKKTIGKLMKK